jgi:hypothetical protein
MERRRWRITRRRGTEGNSPRKGSHHKLFLFFDGSSFGSFLVVFEGTILSPEHVWHAEERHRSWIIRLVYGTRRGAWGVEQGVRGSSNRRAASWETGANGRELRWRIGRHIRRWHVKAVVSQCTRSRTAVVTRIFSTAGGRCNCLISYRDVTVVVDARRSTSSDHTTATRASSGVDHKTIGVGSGLRAKIGTLGQHTRFAWEGVATGHAGGCLGQRVTLAEPRASRVGVTNISIGPICPDAIFTSSETTTTSVKAADSSVDVRLSVLHTLGVNWTDSSVGNKGVHTASERRGGIHSDGERMVTRTVASSVQLVACNITRSHTTARYLRTIYACTLVVCDLAMLGCRVTACVRRLICEEVVRTAFLALFATHP